MAKSDDKSDAKMCSMNTKHDITIHLSEVERAFKRLRVDESSHLNKELIDKKCNHHLDVSSLKLCPNSIKKSSLQDKRQSLNGFRRRFHSLTTIKEKSNSLHSKKTLIEDNYEFGAKSCNINKYKDFSQIKSVSNERTESSTQFCFSSDSKALSDWRSNCDTNCGINCGNTSTPNAVQQKQNKVSVKEEKTCARQALCDSTASDASVDELAAYFDDNLYLPRKMSFMAEMMYT